MLKMFKPVDCIFMFLGFCHVLFGIEVGFLTFVSWNVKGMQYCCLSFIFGIACLFVYYKLTKITEE